MNKIVIWGLGIVGQELYREMLNNPQIYIDNIEKFTDNNEQLWESKIDNISVISPNELNEKEFDILVIASTYENQIRKQIQMLGIDFEKVFSLESYKHKCYADYQYRKKYNLSKKYNAVFDKRIVVYTAITGNYDELKEPIFIDKNIDYVCFTNNRNIKSNNWNIEYINDKKMDNMHLAKKIKIFPNLFVKEYETSIWIDGKFEIKNDLRKYIEMYEKDKPILCFPHFARDCIYEEMAACIYLKKGIKEAILRQAFQYFSEGYPLDNGLYEMGCIVRNHNDELVIKLMKNWWKEIITYSYRDQISFPYVCWKNHFLPDICNLDINNNKWLFVYAHN